MIITPVDWSLVWEEEVTLKRADRKRDKATKYDPRDVGTASEFHEVACDCIIHNLKAHRMRSRNIVKFWMDDV